MTFTGEGETPPPVCLRCRSIAIAFRATLPTEARRYRCSFYALSEATGSNDSIFLGFLSDWIFSAERLRRFRGMVFYAAPRFLLSFLLSVLKRPLKRIVSYADANEVSSIGSLSERCSFSTSEFQISFSPCCSSPWPSYPPFYEHRRNQRRSPPKQFYPFVGKRPSPVENQATTPSCPLVLGSSSSTRSFPPFPPPSRQLNDGFRRFRHPRRGLPADCQLSAARQ